MNARIIGHLTDQRNNINRIRVMCICVCLKKLNINCTQLFILYCNMSAPFHQATHEQLHVTDMHVPSDSPDRRN